MQFLLSAIVLLRSFARATASIRAKIDLFGYLEKGFIRLFVYSVIWGLCLPTNYFNRKERNSLRKERKVF
jgi:hypothetical protein